MADWDIHEYAERIETAKRFINRSEMHEENKKLLLEFERACLVEGLSAGRRAKLLRHMKDVAMEFLPRPFTKVTKSDLQEAIARLESRQGYSVYTKRDVKVAIRKFFKWLVFQEDALSRDDWPDLVSWIKPAVKKKDAACIRASDLLSPEDVEQMIRLSKNPRNRAFIALLYELGARVGELGCLRVGDISSDEYSFLVDLDGKTGKRTVRVVLYAGHLVSWLNVHPAREDPASPLWPSLRPKRYLQPLPYRDLSAWIRSAAQDAGLKKRIYPHLFRHSRACAWTSKDGSLRRRTWIDS